MLAGLALWDIDDPVLYEMEVTLESRGGFDRLAAPFGFRTAEFAIDGFRLNGRLLKICGLNRRQAYPYAGYAMGRRAQERDAEILKHGLKCNLVRTSHYPQSPWFLDHCDRNGFLVFEEIPGWQHIVGEAWKREALEDVRRMIRRDWNRPSIVISGVRINGSQDDHDFYLELPGTDRGRIPLRPQAEVTGLPHPVTYLVTELNGHMHSTKRIDQEQRQTEHVTRYLQALNAAYGDPQIGLHRLVHSRLQHPQGFRLGRPHLPPRRARHVPRAEIRGLRLREPGRLLIGVE